MTVKELNPEQLEELKQRYYDEKLIESEDRSADLGELADIDSLVSDEEIFAEYADTNFTEDDFFCTAGQ